MWRSPILVTAAASLAVTVAQARDELRFDSEDHDARLARYIEASASHVEAVTGLRLVTQTVDLVATSWGDMGRLPLAPVQSITSVGYIDPDGASQVLSGATYVARLTGLQPGLSLAHGASWPATRLDSDITLRAVVGYGAAEVQPGPIVSAILLMVRAMNDEGVIDGVRAT
ncbi:MAG: hypothetical protein B7Z15_22575, partial [Rhizobiales bacterium 32-66-8]